MVAPRPWSSLGLLAISAGDPAHRLGSLAVFAVLTGFASATQDIVIDAWRIEAVDASRQGAMAAAYQWGYRIANIVAGAAPLLLADRFGWHVAYVAMAVVMGAGRGRRPARADAKPCTSCGRSPTERPAAQSGPGSRRVVRCACC